MSFTFTSFDKAILAAVLGPLIVLATQYVDGQLLVWPRDYVLAAAAALIAGLGVYLKGNLPTKP
jgi:hypothetical protein